MARTAEVLARAREIFLSLPDTKETITWSEPHMRVGDKIFGGVGEKDGRVSIGFKLEMDHADARVQGDPRFKRAAYVGHKGWVSMDLGGAVDWVEVRALVGESYRLIAPKKSLAKLGGVATPGGETATRKPASAKRTAAAGKAASAKKRVSAIETVSAKKTATDPGKAASARKPAAKKASAKKPAAKKAAAKPATQKTAAR